MLVIRCSIKWCRGNLLEATMAALLLLILAASSIQQFTNGEVFSCASIEHQSGRSELLKAELPHMPMRATSNRQKAILPFEIASSFESLESPCGAGSVPIYDHQSASARKHFASRGSALRKFYGPQAAGDLVFEHAVAQVDGQTRGVEGFINIWSPAVAQKAEYSLSMVRVIGGKSGDENVIEAGVQVFPEKFGDAKPRLFVTWTADGFQKTGCYNLDCPGFVQLGGPPLGSAVTAFSQINSTQFGMTFLIFQDKPTGNWFFFLEGVNIGLWPASLFNAFSKGGTLSQWGGEISNLNTNNRHTATDMGSGGFANRGMGFSAFIRDLRTVNEQNALAQAQNAVTESDTPKCYSVSKRLSGPDPLNVFFFYGGPGQNSNCP